FLSWIRSPGFSATQKLKTNHRENVKKPESQEMRSYQSKAAKWSKKPYMESNGVKNL
ncbi:Hypothetical predicted protein, partial [Marmota monax]